MIYEVTRDCRTLFRRVMDSGVAVFVSEHDNDDISIEDDPFNHIEEELGDRLSLFLSKNKPERFTREVIFLFVESETSRAAALRIHMSGIRLILFPFSPTMTNDELGSEKNVTLQYQESGLGAFWDRGPLTHILISPTLEDLKKIGVVNMLLPRIHHIVT